MVLFDILYTIGRNLLPLTFWDEKNPISVGTFASRKSIWPDSKRMLKTVTVRNTQSRNTC